MARVLRTLFALGVVSCLAGCARRTAPPSPTTAASGAPAAVPGRCLAAEQTMKYAAFFVASEAHVRTVFVGWRPPQAPRPKTMRNPLTGKDESVMTTEPDDTPGGSVEPWDLRLADLPRDAGYEGYLESRIPPEIRRLPHRPWKNALFETMALAEALAGKDDLPAALFPPSGCAQSLPLLRMPDAAVTALRDADGDATAKLVTRLGKHEAFADWRASDISAFLDDLRALSKAASAADRIYLLPV